MSADRNPSATGQLKACGRLGTTIRISAGDGREVARGIEEIELPVPEGLYAVEWSSAGRRSETLVRVVAGDRAVARQSPADADDPAADAPVRLALESHDRNIWSTGTSRVNKSILVVDVLARDLGPLNDLTGMIQLGSLGGERDLPGERLEGGDHLGGVVWSDVTPGRYRLRFPATNGETLDLTVPVLDSRITVVRMVATRATALLQEGDGFVRTPTYGIDPTRTVITTALHSDAGGHARGQQELAETLLRDLASGTSSLSERITGLLEGSGTDPLLRIYAAAVVASCLESRSAPALDAPWPETADAQARLTRSWCRRARGWLSGSKRSGMPPDATAILWQIDNLAILHGGTKAASAAKSIQAPTMLECAWRWSIARSTADRNALQGFSGIRAAARSAGGTTPWLCWQGAAAKAVSNQAPMPEAELSELVSAVAEKSIRLRSGRGGPRGKVPEDLPADVAITALRSEQVMEAAGTGRQSVDGTSPAGALSLALTLPQGALGTRLARASGELDRRLAQGGGQLAASPDKDAPGWTERVLHRNDPNKGRFGGDASAGGYRLTADFSATKGKSWVTIVINVEGPANDGDPVVLYLHDSFRPPRYVERFKGGRASLKVTSWGGFTVGAWIRSRRLELELDLAVLPEAPRIVRER